ncbi:MAG: ABC transporter ATP-binding protein [Deltaproteobacteria bacterium]|nr:ABC transporter ATP-binding protein [Deltaproteobacteria bacterium]
MSSEKVAIKGLCKSFGRQKVLDGLDISFEIGERVALVGQNGAGKTTLIRCLLGQLGYEGQINIFGMDPRKDRLKVLERTGFVPQHPPPLQMSVAELVALSTGLNGKDSLGAVIETANKLGLDIEQHGRQVFSKLSGGMKQKVLIALALARRPSILIMDEPAANLDPEGREALYQHLNDSASETFMLLSSHRVDEIRHLISRVTEMDCGKIVLDSPVSEVLHHKEKTGKGGRKNRK